jgi:type II secretion system protein L
MIPGELCPARRVEVRGDTDAQRRAAARLETDGQIAAPPDSAICAVGPVENGGALVCRLARSDFEAWVHEARQEGFEPDLVVPDYMLLPEPAAGEIRMAMRDEIALIRERRGAFASPPDLLVLLLAGASARESDLESDVRQAIMSGRLFDARPAFDPSELETGRDRRAPALARVFAGLLLAAILGAAVPHVSAARLDQQTRALRAEADALARTALTPGERIVNARAQLAERAEPHLSTGRMTSLAREAIREISTLPGARVASLDLLTDPALLVRLVVPAGGDLAGLKTRLEAAGIEMTDPVSAPGASPDTVEFQIRRAS